MAEGKQVRVLVLAGGLLATALSLVAPNYALSETGGVAPDINGQNWYWGPGNRWSYLHTRRIFPSADVQRGDGPVVKPDPAPREIDGISFVDPVSKAPMTIAQMYAATDTDALLVLKGLS